MKLWIGVTFLITSVYGSTIGCKYQMDVDRVKKAPNKIKFMFDNHCANVHNAGNWKVLKREGKYTLIQSPHKGEENYKYWMETKYIPSPTPKKTTNKKLNKKDHKSVFYYGDLMWQDSLINETKKMLCKEAKQYCSKLKYHNSTSWRLPYLDEFLQIRSRFSESHPYKFKHLELKEWYWTKENKNFVFSTGAESRAFDDEPVLVRCVAPRK